MPKGLCPILAIQHFNQKTIVLWLTDEEEELDVDVYPRTKRNDAEYQDIAYHAVESECSMCITPITLKRDYKTIDGEFTKVVPCGKCVKCLQRRQNAWAFRLSEEAKRETTTSVCFMTLTYEEAPVSFNGYPTLEKKDFQNFMKRLQKKCPTQIINEKRTKNIKYYACGEYGSQTQRPHYHAIVFNLPQNLITNDAIAPIWSHGIVDIGNGLVGGMRYVTKYAIKGNVVPSHELDDRLPEFSLMSKRLGDNHLTPEMVRYYKQRAVSYVTLPGGIPTSMPRYFREKIFTKEERKIMAEAAREAREFDFEKLFDNCFKNEIEWKLMLIRRQEKQAVLERAGL